MRLTSALLFTMLLACDSPTATPEGSAAKPGASAKPLTSAKPSAAAGGASAAATPKLCEKADKLQQRLAGIDAKAERVSIDADVAIPESKDGAKVFSTSIVVTIGPKDIRVGGQSVTKPADVKDKLNGQRSVLLAIPKGEEGIGRIADVVAAIGSDTEVYMIAMVPGSKLESAPKGLVLTGKDQSERARMMAEALSKSIGDCPEAGKLFQSLASSDPSGRGELVKKDLPVAINACGCKVADNTEDLIAFLLGGDPPVVGKKLNLSKEKDAKAIKLKGLDGQKLYEALPADGSPVKLEK